MNCEFLLYTLTFQYNQENKVLLNSEFNDTDTITISELITNKTIAKFPVENGKTSYNINIGESTAAIIKSTAEQNMKGLPCRE